MKDSKSIYTCIGKNTKFILIKELFVDGKNAALLIHLLYSFYFG